MRVVLILALLSTSLSAQSRLGPTDGVAAIRLQRSGVDVRWENKVGRALSELAILATAREHDQPYEWSLHEMEAVAVGLDPAVIDAVRNKKALTGIGEKEAAIIQLARDIARHKVRCGYLRACIKDVWPIESGRRRCRSWASARRRLRGSRHSISRCRRGGNSSSLCPSLRPPTFTPTREAGFPSSAPLHSPLRCRRRSIAAEWRRKERGPRRSRVMRARLASLEASVGRPLIDVAALVAARAHDQRVRLDDDRSRRTKDGVVSGNDRRDW